MFSFGCFPPTPRGQGKKLLVFTACPPEVLRPVFVLRVTTLAATNDHVKDPARKDSTRLSHASPAGVPQTPTFHEVRRRLTAHLGNLPGWWGVRWVEMAELTQCTPIMDHRRCDVTDADIAFVSRRSTEARTLSHTFAH